jgi:hypothetical protein
MKTTRLAVLILVINLVLISGRTPAEQGVRHLPEHDVVVPDTVSPAMQAVIGRPLSPFGTSTQNQRRNGRLLSRERQMHGSPPFRISDSVWVLRSSQR